MPDLDGAVIPDAGGPAVSSGGASVDLKKLVPLSLFSTVVCILLAVYHLYDTEAPVALASLRAGVVEGQVKVSDGMRDWELTQGMAVAPGQTVVTSSGSRAFLQGLDPKTGVVLFEGSRFTLRQLERVEGPGKTVFKLFADLQQGEAVMKFRSETTTWGVEVILPGLCYLYAKRDQLFKAAYEQDSVDIVVAQGMVAAVEDPKAKSQNKAYIYADNKMRSSPGEPIRRPEAANVLSERWGLQ